MANIFTEGGEPLGKNMEEIPLNEGGVNRQFEGEVSSADNQNYDAETVKKERELKQENFLKDLREEGGDNKRKLKTNSLKRFFRLPSKKSSEKAEVSASGSGIDAESQLANSETDDNSIDDDVEIDGSGSARGPHRRFKLRLGGMQRHVNSLDGESKIDLGTASKISLKSSLSNYWNSVFKKKTSKSLNDIEDPKDVKTTNFMETPDQHDRMAEDIHSLKISDDNQAD
ncbi:uncharacterized protein LOC142237836 [Haematobia irritans]|uniref:uncharacterized protein LOC142237836 n=1 Tax=Haematobia irritans TaxID=7368 RepID=UPI003F4F4F1F